MTQPNFPQSADNDEPTKGRMEDDDDEELTPLPPATDDEVLNDTARLAREGRRKLDEDENEPANRNEDKPLA